MCISCLAANEHSWTCASYCAGINPGRLGGGALCREKGSGIVCVCLLRSAPCLSLSLPFSPFSAPSTASKIMLVASLCCAAVGQRPPGLAQVTALWRPVETRLHSCHDCRSCGKVCQQTSQYAHLLQAQDWAISPFHVLIPSTVYFTFSWILEGYYEMQFSDSPWFM